jgi:hypothetical protein
MKENIIASQPSWRIAMGDMEACVTKLGGQLGPIRFGKIQPYSVAPWAGERIDPETPAILRVLRGDFFCLPFGGNATPFRGERHPVHGETANNKWKLESRTAHSLHISLRTRIRSGRVDKRVFLRPGHHAIYQQHVVSQMRGPMNFGHHAMLKFPDQPEAGIISTSPFVYGQVLPVPFENPEQGGYSTLKRGAAFTSLNRVALANGGFTDLSRYPARRGFEDLAMVVSDSALPFAWTAVTFPKQRYVWFALKDPRVLRQTVFWISNRGRHYPPWSSRHVNVMGLEEVTAYFHLGLAESAGRNPLATKGIPTCLRLNPKRPTVVNYIMGVAPIPKSFDSVAAITSARDGKSIILAAHKSRCVNATLDLNFLTMDELKIPEPESFD